MRRWPSRNRVPEDRMGCALIESVCPDFFRRREHRGTHAEDAENAGVVFEYWFSSAFAHCEPHARIL
jgi:hypothetical protein